MKPKFVRKVLIVRLLISIVVLSIVVGVLWNLTSISWKYNDVAGSVWRSQDAGPRIEVVSAGSSLDSVYCVVRISDTTRKRTKLNVSVVLYGSPTGNRSVMKKKRYTMELSADTVLYYYVAPRWNSGHPESHDVFYTKSQGDTLPLYTSRIYPELVIHARPLLH